MQTKTLENFKNADELVAQLLVLSEEKQICLLDSCGVSHLGSRFLLCGLSISETYEISDENYEKTLKFFEEKLEKHQTLAIFTLSYELGLKINRLESQKILPENLNEPDIFLALFDCWLIHDYETQETLLCGNEMRFDEIENQLKITKNHEKYRNFRHRQKSIIKSNFTKAEYLEKIGEIKEFIRHGDTYQTNLTQQFTAELPENLSPQQIFYNLRKNHRAPFAAFLQRHETTVISGSPERFFKVQKPIISTSPIKGTRPRGKNAEEDEKLKNELLNSAKDRAENVMIVDLLRNDLGRICDFGTVKVEKLCDLEEHPTLFHLVSTITGNLRPKTTISDIIKAIFPCGSITGAPKIRTMQIINELETAKRAISMGAIGYSVHSAKCKAHSKEKSENYAMDLSVSIRTMTIKNNCATFNVGGGIVIDSSPEKEYEETLVKAKALFNAINGFL